MTNTVVSQIIDDLNKVKKRHRGEMEELESMASDEIKNLKEQIEKEGTTGDVVVDYEVMDYREKIFNVFLSKREFEVSHLKVFENIKEMKEFEKKLEENVGNCIFRISSGFELPPHSHPTCMDEAPLFRGNRRTYDVYALGKIAENNGVLILGELVDDLVTKGKKYKYLYINTEGKFIEFGDTVVLPFAKKEHEPKIISKNMIYWSHQKYEFIDGNYNGKYKEAVDKMMPLLIEQT